MGVTFYKIKINEQDYVANMHSFDEFLSIVTANKALKGRYFVKNQ